MAIDYVKDVKQTANNTTGKTQTKSKVQESKNVNSVFTDSTAIAASIKKDVSAKNRYGLPTTGKDLGKHVRQITTENSFDVYQNYKSRNGETIMSAILAERGLDINERTEYCRYIWNAMLRNAKQQGVNVNDLDKQFMTELYKQKNSILPANATKINKLVTQMINRCNGTESSPKPVAAETAKTAKTAKTSKTAANSSSNKTITETDSVKQSKQIVSELDTAHKKFKQVDGSGYKKPDTIASALKSDIYGLGTHKNFVKHIKDITSANVWKVTSSYRNKTGNNLFEDIMSEHGLDINTRLECCRHVWNAMLRDMKAEGVYTKDLDTAFMAELKKQKDSVLPASGSKMRELQVKMLNRYGERRHNSGAAANGKIDHAFSQGQTGDCWLLAGIKSIANNPQAKKILEDCIQVDKKNGDVTVTLKGPGKTYKITKSELLGRKELSSGDLDVRAIEIAVERYQQDYPNKKIYGVLGKRDNLEGNTSNRAFQLLLGTSNYEDYFGGFGLAKDALITKTDSIIDKAQKGDSLIQVARSHFDKKNRYAINEHGKKVRVENDHAYSVTGADDKYVYFVNPWDTGETLKQTHQEFKDTFRSTGVVSMKEVFEKEDKRRYKNGVNINA